MHVSTLICWNVYRLIFLWPFIRDNRKTKVLLFWILIDHFCLDWLVFSRLLIVSFFTAVVFFYFLPYEIPDFLFPFIPHLFHSFLDRKSTRLNSSHVSISYVVFCLN